MHAISAPPIDAPSRLYVSNRAPLRVSPFVQLPTGAIAPKGWLRKELENEANGMVGHLPEVSHWAKFKGNAWANPNATGGWEEAPYWLKGYGDLGYVLHDQKIIDNTKRWVDAILSSQREDGWFGPRSLLASKDCDGHADLWPNMLALNVVEHWYDYSGDPRVLPFMTKYFRWELDYPDKDFLLGYWPKMRGGDNLESVYWLYNRTGDAWLLDLAKKLHDHTSNWTKGVANYHGVNFTECFREPAEYWQQAKDPKFLKATENDYASMMGTYGQVPGGGFGADENARPGYTDPRQGFETCSMVEYMHSFEMLSKMTGNPLWADHCEDVAINSLPAALTPDEKGLHYLTSPNQISLDPGNKSPGIQNGGEMFSYSPGEVYRCCQHNVAMGWPYYAENLWLATADNGLCASLYAASEVKAKVADGTQVKILEETEYPFGETVNLKFSMAKAARFPLYLRVPAWCDEPHVNVKGADEMKMLDPGGPRYLVINQLWSDGDTLTLTLPMKLRVRVWAKNKNAVSIDRGPITYALKIGEKWQRSGPGLWPDYTVTATTPWNYGLVLDEKNPAASMQFVQKPSAVSDDPFRQENVPGEIHAKAKRIPAWTADEKNLIRPLQMSPVKSDEPTETVTLIPMGAARLRISEFPVIGAGPDAHEWTAAGQLPKASYCNPGDTTAALNDGIEPQTSHDESIPRFTWWDHTGTAEWVQYDFPKPRKLSAVQVYWFDDTGRGQCRVPQSWKVLYLDGSQWKPVQAKGDFGTAPDQYNAVTFAPVETTGLRVQVRLQKGYSGGILQWKVKE
ncbi:MAG TPA: beta-L-arabinofuranosidase domain-containing protein [Tepidisphaeraceae bacterium]|nr:beta-L-arabinofuranosidase domain-containing protein [Tepidisphaeraceae bacterium]